MAVSCDNCHQQFSRGTSVSRHIADRCLFQPEHSDDDLKLTVKDDIIHIINNQPNMYQKIQQCLMIKTSCPSVYPLIFTPKGNFSTNPSVKYLSKIGAVNRYDILSKAIWLLLQDLFHFRRMFLFSVTIVLNNLFSLGLLSHKDKAALR